MTFSGYLLASIYFEWKLLKNFNKVVAPTWKCHFHVLLMSWLRHSWFCIIFEAYGWSGFGFIKHFEFLLFWFLKNTKYINSLLSDTNIGCHVTLWCHNSASVHHSRISSSTNAVKFKFIPEILLDKRCWLITSSF